MTLPEYSPIPGSPEERQAYLALQPRLKTMFEEVYPDPQAPRGVVVLPGLSLDRETLRKLTGAQSYEERQLSMLTWLRLPRTQVVFLTSSPVPDTLVDYYLGMLWGVPHSHARARLTMLSCNDSGDENLTRKILSRPRLLQRIRNAIVDPAVTHLTAFNTTPDEVTLAVQLGIPLYGCDPALNGLGTKSGGRKNLQAGGHRAARRRRGPARPRRRRPGGGGAARAHARAAPRGPQAGGGLLRRGQRDARPAPGTARRGRDAWLDPAHPAPRGGGPVRRGVPGRLHPHGRHRRGVGGGRGQDLALGADESHSLGHAGGHLHARPGAGRRQRPGLPGQHLPGPRGVPLAAGGAGAQGGRSSCSSAGSRGASPWTSSSPATAPARPGRTPWRSTCARAARPCRSRCSSS
ncbi:MAG: hypothetical protein QM765_45795 [Myxococcales bacterium]